ncbi:hypothetical protein K2Z84_21475 [Candidatus Binatia bacterium]|nr:hypothetical protein [Candidatus Binatia bacterium]
MIAFITVTRERGEIEVEIEGNATPVVPGRYSGPPELCYPDEGGEAEIESSVCSCCGKAVELSAEERARAEAALRKVAEDEAEAAAEAAAEARAEARAEGRWS